MFQSALVCGAIAGWVESTVCHPLDTIKTRMQNKGHATFSETVQRIHQKHGWKGFYRGLSAVYAGVLPKNAVRFASFDTYRHYVPTWCAGVLAGATEAVLVVHPTDVLKIRVQAQFHSMNELPKKSMGAVFRELLQTPQALWRGVPLTVIRQSINQGANFTVFHWLRQHTDAPSFVAGCCSGAVGPLLNHPVDVVKTRIPLSNGMSVKDIVREMVGESGWRGFYRGIGPRLLRIVPGQGITFLVYDLLKR
jgi:solute carrier family 25 citrate transporter 1